MSSPMVALTLMTPFSSLLDGLGHGCRVKAKPADAGRFASLDTAAMAKGGQLRGGRGRSRSLVSPHPPRSVARSPCN